MKTGTEIKKRKKAPPLWPMLMMIVFIIVGSFGYRGFNFYTDRLLGQILMDIVQRETDSLYTISYDEVSFNLINDKLTLTNFSLNLDSGTAQDPVSLAALDRRNLYQAQIPQLEILTNRLWEIYFKRELKIRGLEIEQPAVNVYSFPTEETPATLSFEAGNLYTTITQYLEVFEIGHFEIKQGSFNFHKQDKEKHTQYNISDLSFALKNFALDSGWVQDSSKLLFAEEVMLNLKNQKVYLPDSIHVLTFEDFVISTKPSEIVFSNLRLQPRPDTANVQISNNRLNIYDIRLPELTIKGVDFAKAYYENTLSIEGIFINNSHFDIDEKKIDPAQVADSIKSEKNDLRSIVTFFFDKILVDHFNLDSALFQVNLEVGNRQQMFAIDNVSMDIRKLNVDTTTAQYRFDDNFTYFEDIDIRVDNYIFHLPDSIHTLRVKEFNLSTEKSQIFLDSVTYTSKYTPEDFRYSSSKPGLYNIVVPNLVLTEVDINKVLDQQRVVVGHLNMQNPDIQLFTHSSGKKAAVQPDSLYVILTDILSSIEISNFMLEDGGFKLSETSSDGLTQVTFNHIDVNTLNLQIDSATYLYTDQLLDADNLNIRFANCYFRLPGAQYTLTTDVGYLLGRNVRQLHLEKVRLQPFANGFDDRTAQIDLYADTVLLENTNLRQMLNEQVYMFENIHLGNPDLKIFLKQHDKDTIDTKQVDTKKLPFLLAQYIDVTNGKLQFFIDSLLSHSLDSTYAQLTDFEFDAKKIGTPQNVLHLSNLRLSGSNYEYHFPDSIHVLTIDDLFSSSPDSNAYITNLSIRPKVAGDTITNQNLIDIAVPVIDLEGHDLYGSLTEGNLNVQKLNAEQPKINLVLAAAKNEAPFRLEDLPQIIAPVWKSTNIEVFALENASVDITQKTENGDHHFIVDDVSLQLNNLSLDSAAQLDNEHFLFADNFEMELNNYAHNLAGKTDTVHVEKASWNNNLFNAKEVFISNTKRGESAAQQNVNYVVSIPSLSLNGVHWHDAYAHRRINWHDVQLDSPQIFIETRQTDTPQSFRFPETYPFDPKKLASIALNTLEMQNATIHVKVHNDSLPLQHTLENSAIFLENLYMDSTVYSQPGNLLFTDNLRFQTEDIRIMLPDSLQILELGKVGFITQDSTLFANNIKLIPRYEKTALAPQVGYQKGWVRLESDSAFLKGVNFYDLLYKQKIIAQKLGINDFTISTYKDKNYLLPDTIQQPTVRELIMDIPYYIKLDTLDLQQGFVDVELLAENGEIPGRIFFSNLQAQAYNITNDSILIQNNPNLTLAASAQVMEEAPLQAYFTFDMLSDDGSHDYSAHLGSMNMQQFNPILEPTALVKIRRGQIDTLNMRVRANKHYAIGNMEFLYDKLRISILDRNKDTIPADKGFVSFFANTFIVNTSNPSLFITREGEIYAERDLRKAMFDHWARSSLSGIISSIGSSRTKKKLKKAQHDALKEQIQVLKEKQEHGENK